MLSDALRAAVLTLPQHQQHAVFAHGLDVGAWATSAASSCPPLDYLNSVAVTLVLTLVIQLSCFRYVWARTGAYPASGSTGHSQGLAAAMVVALAMEDTFDQYATSFARVLLFLGAAIAERVIPGCSYALAVLKLPTDAVAALIQAEGAPVHLVVRSGAHACTLTGTPAALMAFQALGCHPQLRPSCCPSPHPSTVPSSWET